MAGAAVVPVVIGLGMLGLWLVVRSHRRAGVDVVADLRSLDTAREGERMRGRGRPKRPALGAFAAPLGCGGGAGFIRAAFFSGSPLQVVGAVLIGSACGYLAWTSRQRRAKERHLERIDFYLPLVMENIVMAVEAGHDVIGALRRVVEVSGAHSGADELDPVTTLIGEVVAQTEAGAGFERSLTDAADRAGNHAIRHAFIHLGIAHREGGELVAPLRELSHSTQLYFQESVEERIAKLPIKATAPLLCTFTGLIICFITTPLIQVMSLTEQAAPREERLGR